MEADLPKPGSYVVAVSGGVDSVSLLHLLKAQPGLKLTVAHFDHGIREDSAADRRFVSKLARQYRLPFVYNEGRLGTGASEAVARTARYDFLRKTRQASQAEAIITAHHQDDVLETAVINMLRGSGRKGLTALGNRPGLLRPLLKVSKRDLSSYAQANGLTWREDSSNQDERYLRNYVRRRLLSRLSEDERERFLQLIGKLQITNDEIDTLLVKQLASQSVTDGIDRSWFNQLPHATAREVLAAWLRAHDMPGFDSWTLERLVIAAKTARPGKSFPVKGGLRLNVRSNHLALTEPER
ncbi:MAG TPA: tRNA lysidine(34) synthetase TilS [Candidatus Saccharimonadales bacterium]